MPSIELDLNTDFKVNDDGELTLAISTDESNLLQVNDDGIYALGTTDMLGVKNGQKTEGITVGIQSTFYPLTENASGRIATTGIVHRTFTSTGEKPGEKLTGRNTNEKFRAGLDHVLPGDIFRVKHAEDSEDPDVYDYYLVLTCDPKKDDNGYALGNVVDKYVKLGSYKDPNIATTEAVDAYKTLWNSLTVIQLKEMIGSYIQVKDARELIDKRGRIAPQNVKMITDETAKMNQIINDFPKDDTKEEQYHMTMEEMCSQLESQGMSPVQIELLLLDVLQNYIE